MIEGKPGDEFFNQPIKSTDHPFLRQFAHADLQRNAQGQLEATTEAKSAMRRPDESEMDYYDRRYKERVCDSFYFFKYFSRK